MKNILLPILTVFLLFISLSCRHSGNTKGVFRISGTHLLDANGNEFVIRGVNVPNAWFPKESYNILSFIAQMKANTVRIVWETKGTVHDLEKVINRCIQLKMIPIIEMHEATGNASNTKLMQMARYFVRDDVRQMLHKYENYLLINIANEWGDHNMADEYWRDSYKQAVDLLRSAGYKTTLVIDACGWGQNSSPIIKYGKELLDYDKENNLLFSIHMYGSWNNEQKIRDDLYKLHSLSIPVIVGEFGYNYKDGDNNLGCKVNHKTILQVCKDMEYGYLAWSWTGNNEANNWLNLVKADDWKTFTVWGNEIFNSPLGIKETAQRASIFNN